MKLLYVSDHRFVRKENGEVFTTGQMGEAYFERFRGSFEYVTVIGLCEEENENNKRKVIERVDVNSTFVRYLFIQSSGTILGKLYALNKIKEKYIDLIPTHDRIVTKAPSLIAHIAAKEAKKHKIPYLIEMVGCAWDALWNHGMKGKIVAPFLWFITRKTIKTTPYVIYVTNNFLQLRYPTLGISTNCSNVALTEFDNGVLEERLKKIANKPNKEKIIIGTTGAVGVRYKGQQFVIEALGRLKMQGNTNYEYQLVGGGDQKYLKSIAEKFGVTEQVKFFGSMPHDEIFKWLDTIDVYSQPSRQEGLPRALIEAMSRGLPAFGAKTAGIPELLEDDYIFSNTNSNITEIISILESLEESKMVEQAKRNYDESKKYDKDIIQSRRIKLYKQFISNNKMM